LLVPRGILYKSPSESSPKKGPNAADIYIFFYLQQQDRGCSE